MKNNVSKFIHVETSPSNSNRCLYETVEAGGCTLIDKQSGFCFVGSQALILNSYSEADVLFTSDNCYVINVLNGKTYKIKQNQGLSSKYFFNNGLIDFNSLLEESSDIEYQGNIQYDINMLLQIQPNTGFHAIPPNGGDWPIYPHFMYKKFKVKNIAQNNNNFIPNNNFPNNMNNNNFIPNNNFPNNMNNNNFIPNNNFPNNMNNNNLVPNNNVNNNNNVNQNMGFSEDPKLPRVEYSVQRFGLLNLPYVINISRRHYGDTTEMPFDYAMYNENTGFCIVSKTNMTNKFLSNDKFDFSYDIVDAQTGKVFKLKTDITPKAFMACQIRSQAMSCLDLNQDKEYNGNIANEVFELERRQKEADNSGVPGASAGVNSKDLFNHFEDLSKLRQACLAITDQNACIANKMALFFQLIAQLKAKSNEFNNNNDKNALNDIESFLPADEQDAQYEEEIKKNKKWGAIEFEKKHDSNKFGNEDDKNWDIYQDKINKIKEYQTKGELNAFKNDEQNKIYANLVWLSDLKVKYDELLKELKKKKADEMKKKQEEEEKKKKEEEEKKKKEEEELSNLKKECLEILDQNACLVNKFCWFNTFIKQLKAKSDDFDNNNNKNALDDIESFLPADQLDAQYDKEIKENKKWGAIEFEKQKDSNWMLYKQHINDIDNFQTKEEFNKFKNDMLVEINEGSSLLPQIKVEYDKLLKELKKKKADEMKKKQEEEEKKKKEEEEKKKKEEEEKKKKEEEELSNLKKECLEILDRNACIANKLYLFSKLIKQLKAKSDDFDNNNNKNALDDIESFLPAKEQDAQYDKEIENNKQWGAIEFEKRKGGDWNLYQDKMNQLNNCKTKGEFNDLKNDELKYIDENLVKLPKLKDEYDELLKELKKKKADEMKKKQEEEMKKKQEEEEKKKKEEEEKKKKEEEEKKKKEEEEKKKKEEEEKKKKEEEEKKKKEEEMKKKQEEEQKKKKKEEEMKKKKQGEEQKKKKKEEQKKKKEEEEEDKVYLLNNKKAYAYQFGKFKKSTTKSDVWDNQGMAMWYNFKDNVFVVGECKDDQMLADKCWVIDAETGQVFNLIKTCDFESEFKFYNIITDEFCKLNDKKEYKGDLNLVLNLIKGAPHFLPSGYANIPQNIYNKIVDNVKKKEEEKQKKEEEMKKKKEEEQKKKEEEQKKKKEEEEEKKKKEEEEKKKEEKMKKKQEEEEKKKKEEEKKKQEEEKQQQEEEDINQVQKMAAFSNVPDEKVAMLLKADFNLKLQFDDVVDIIKDTNKSEEDKQQAISNLRKEIEKKKQKLIEEQHRLQEEARKKKQQQMLDKSQEHVLLNDFKTTEEEYEDFTKQGKRPEVNILICIITFICVIVPMIIYLQSVFAEQAKYDQKKQQLEHDLEARKKAYQEKQRENMQKHGSPTPNSERKTVNNGDILSKYNLKNLNPLNTPLIT